MLLLVIVGAWEVRFSYFIFEEGYSLARESKRVIARERIASLFISYRCAVRLLIAYVCWAMI